MRSTFARSVTAVLLLASAVRAAPFVVKVIDESTGRGVPLVQLKTTNELVFYTDSAGVCVLDEPAFEGQRVFLLVSSPGYEYPKDGFGYRGTGVDVKAGQTATIKLKRLNVAERLYRATGEGIYRDSVIAAIKPPIEAPLLNGGAVGQDSVQAAVYRGKIYWFWGDTSRLSYPLGLFNTAGATSVLPGEGGLDPERGVDFEYFVGKDGFARAMTPSEQSGPVWIEGVTTVTDAAGRERLVGHTSRMKNLSERVERNLVVFDDKKNVFVPSKSVPLDGPPVASGQAFHARDGETEYVYFTVPFPTLRVRATFDDFQNPAAYEAYTPLPVGAKFDGDKTRVERDANGRAVWAWRRGGTVLDAKQVARLIDAKLLSDDDVPTALRDAGDGKRVLLHNSAVRWNAHRKRYVMIGVETMGRSVLGEVWYAEAERPEGPWRKAVRIATHGGMDFYNPAQHDFFTRDEGRHIFFEGTYTKTFSGIKEATPRYEYNQLMYRLDVDDARLAPTR